MSPALTATGARKLSTKLLVTQIVFLLIALGSIGLTLLVSWRLEGSAAAINDAGSLRMRAWRLAYLASADGSPDRAAAATEIKPSIADFDAVFATLRSGDPARPLFLPRSAEVNDQLRLLDGEWRALSQALSMTAAGAPPPPRAHVERFVAHVNNLVVTVEEDIARTTAALRYAQLALVALAIAGTVALMYLSFLLVIRPLTRLHEGIERMAAGDLSVRLPVETRDEFGQVTAGFNDMAQRLEAVYQTLESRVEQKTRKLAERTARLATLYDMAAFLNLSQTTHEMCEGFLARVQQAFTASSGAVRLASADGKLLFYSVRDLAAPVVENERCLAAGECACGKAAERAETVVQFHDGRLPQSTLPHCRDAGYACVVATPIATHGQVLGVFTLFFRQARDIGADERHLLDTLGQHLGTALETVRLGALEKEVAISDERNLLAQELHDSIAQSLAFLNLQVQMLSSALAGDEQQRAQSTLGEIRTGVQECYADVRELLVHFRTRLAPMDLKSALAAMVSTFERRTGIAIELAASGSAVPLTPDRQLQLLHVVHEALSNARKHARCSRVEVTLSSGPGYKVSIRDNGVGFDPANINDPDEHVGLRIMRERAGRAGGTLEVRSAPGEGTEVVLSLPATEHQVHVERQIA
ncbi:MAG TPA: type IV pili methyl-accepting chemotaxis transducer N-terminal domain-containing protein [Casimicrobiaceae bacterium]|nr:type IV pili methyl-accepting chemotaxis transducer N-terminal domain-containing protein [Casimicrobiaceae bacterium]